jgi:hypothetical protein
VHAIKIIGWRVENGFNFRISVKFWNEEEVIALYFKNSRGSNEFGIENSVNAGESKL